MHGLRAVPPHGDFGRRPLYTLLMGFLVGVLGLLVGGYILGIGTACTVFRERQPAYEDGAPEQLSKPGPLARSRVAGTPGLIR
jgi:hypothetical protein